MCRYSPVLNREYILNPGYNSGSGEVARYQLDSGLEQDIPVPLASHFRVQMYPI